MKQILLLIIVIVFQIGAFGQIGDEYRSLPLLGDDEDIYRSVDQAARFPGCEELTTGQHEKEACSTKKLLEYIYSNFKIPEEAKNGELKGQIVIEFVIAFDGTIRNVHLVKGFETACDIAAIKVIEDMNNLDDLWIPGVLDDEDVNVKYTLPIKVLYKR